MEQWLLFDRVYGNRRGIGIVQVVEDAIVVLIHPAHAEFAGANCTLPLAGMTPNPGAGELLIKQRLSHPHPPFRYSNTFTMTCNFMFA